MAGGARFFRGPAAFRAWLDKNHRTAAEILVGFKKRHTGKPSMTWPESVAVALCYGWIDGIRQRMDDERYTIRFTPRRPSSVWSAVNVRLIAELEAAGGMTDAGRAAFAARKDPTSKGYSYERREADLDEARVARFKRNRAAWRFFTAQPPGYRKLMLWWVMSAKQEVTRDRRFARLLEASAAGKRIT
jgi:uncharacterized protein YdeI (YjbR/CyaY-like superfamily)